MTSKLLPDKTILYKYTCVKGVLSTLQSQSIRLAPLHKLNDPFEVNNMILMNFDEAEFKSKLLQKLTKYVFNELQCPHPSWFTKGYLSQWRNTYIKNPHDFHSREKVVSLLTPIVEVYVNSYKANSDIMAKKLWDEIFGEYVVFCTTTTPNNVKMLTHYANDHKGVVIGFQAHKDIDSAFLTSKPITYSDHPPILQTLDEHLKQTLGEEIFDYSKSESANKMVFTKHTMWANEEELRMAYPAKKTYEDGYEYIKIVPKEIHSIYFGCRVDALDKELIMLILELKYPHILLFDLVADRQSNGFNCEPLQN